MLIALLLLTTGVCALLGGEGGGASRVLWCFCSLFQVPLLFFALGGWSRERAPTVGQAGRLGAGFALLCGAEKALLFWAGALGAPVRSLTCSRRRTPPGFFWPWRSACPWGPGWIGFPDGG